ncbi:MAG: hypothetical protein EOS59_33195, partial [Mesorhizobium sp.]
MVLICANRPAAEAGLLFKRHSSQGFGLARLPGSHKCDGKLRRHPTQPVVTRPACRPAPPLDRQSNRRRNIQIRTRSMNRTIPLILAVALFMENMDSTVIAT